MGNYRVTMIDFNVSVVRLVQIEHPMRIGCARPRKTFETRSIFLARAFCLITKKKNRSTSFSRIGKAMKKLQYNCCILIKFSYLMASKLLHLLMDWETFN